MVERAIRVSNTLGVHARPASKIVQAANGFKSEIRIVNTMGEADAKSILHVMMLGATYDSAVTIRASGVDEQEAADAIAGLFARNFDEE